MKRSILFSVLLTLSMGLAHAAPPERMNYQGVLRDAADKPLSGSYTMVFRFYDAASGGNLLLTDTHTGGAAVSVSGGLFNALLGDGALTAGTHASLGEVFANESDVYLEVQVIDETLTPRIRVASAGYALNSARLDGRPAGGFIDTSAVTQTKAGDLALGDLTVAGNDIFFDGGSKIVSTPGNLQLRNDGNTDDLVLLPGSSWHNGRLQMNGSGKWELRAANGIFEFMQGSSNDPIARLTADGSLVLGGELSAGSVPLAMPPGPLDLYVNASTGDDLDDGLSPATAKQTIQAAIDVIPLVLGGPVTVHVADGTYHETLLLWERFRRGLHLIRLEGNATSPQSVLLDGQDLLDQGMMISDPGVEIVGFRISNFEEYAISFFLGGGAVVENCEIIDNNSDPWNGAVELDGGAWCDMVDSLVSNNSGSGFWVGGAYLELINTIVSENLSHGVEVTAGGELVIQGATITGNGESGIRASLSDVTAFSGGAEISGNGWGVHAASNSRVDFYGQTGIVIQNNTNDDMRSQSHSTIQGYGSGTVGTCVEADGHSICSP